MNQFEEMAVETLGVFLEALELAGYSEKEIMYALEELLKGYKELYD